MDRFRKYVQELFVWNEQLKNFLASENGEEHSELWNKLDHFTDLIEGVSSPLSDQELIDLQSKAEIIHADMENYFRKKQK
jgi:Fe-Mn family superoxide dismutase